MESEKILVNCALPYANGPTHLGHIAGAYLGADIFVRFNRMLGKEVLFISGSDEYGTPITISAEKNHVTPQEIADKFHNMQISYFLTVCGKFIAKQIKYFNVIFIKGFGYSRGNS